VDTGVSTVLVAVAVINAIGLNVVAIMHAYTSYRVSLLRAEFPPPDNAHAK
jgi:hypothetical protein